MAQKRWVKVPSMTELKLPEAFCAINAYPRRRPYASPGDLGYSPRSPPLFQSLQSLQSLQLFQSLQSGSVGAGASLQSLQSSVGAGASFQSLQSLHLSQLFQFFQGEVSP